MCGVGTCPVMYIFFFKKVFLTELATGAFSYLLWFPVLCEFVAWRNDVTWIKYLCLYIKALLMYLRMREDYFSEELFCLLNIILKTNSDNIRCLL